MHRATQKRVLDTVLADGGISISTTNYFRNCI